MRLLEAVNFIMPKLGERPVTTLEQRHPTLAVILPAFDSARKEMLLGGWWFNEFSTTLYPDNDGRIALGEDVLMFEPGPGYSAIERGEFLWNPTTNTGVFSGPVKGVTRNDIAFDELPNSAAEFLKWTVLITSSTEDLGVTQEMQVWQAGLSAAYDRLISEHLRNRQYTTKDRPQWRKLRRAMRA